MIKTKDRTTDNQMVRRLRRRFVRTAMISLFLILVLLIGVINISNFVQIDQQANGALKILQDNDGNFPAVVPSSSTDASTSEDTAGSGNSPQPGPAGPGPNPPVMPDFDETHRLEAPFETRYYWVRLDPSGQITDSDTSHVAAVNETQARSSAASVYASGKTTGFLYTYKYSMQQCSDGTSLIVFVDCSSSIASAMELLRSSLLLGAAALVLMFVLVWCFAGRAVAPVVESLDKQKRFISDAGHELKTPIAVISANVDVLEMTGTKNKWTQSIRHQTRRMTDLVNNLLPLTRMEEGSFRQMFTTVDFTGMVRESVSTYETVAQAAGKTLTSSVEEGILLEGEPKSLQQLCTLLLDNAVKYSDPQGKIQVNLSRKTEKRGGSRSEAVLEVSNTCDQLPEGNLDRLFDRFYRADTSRTHQKNASGGFGIGLSVARAICTSHHGTIEALRGGDNIIIFRAELPIRQKCVKGTGTVTHVTGGQVR